MIVRRRIVHSILALLLIGPLAASLSRSTAALYHCDITGEYLAECCCKEVSPCCRNEALKPSPPPCYDVVGRTDGKSTSKALIAKTPDCDCCHVFIVEVSEPLP